MTLRIASNSTEEARFNKSVRFTGSFTRGNASKSILDAWVNGEWQQVSSHGAIGYKRIHRFLPVQSDRFRVRILESRAPACISRASVHFYDEPPNPIKIRFRTNNQISLAAGVIGRHGSFSSSATQKIHYTLDGTEPGIESPVYEGSLLCPKVDR